MRHLLHATLLATLATTAQADPWQTGLAPLTIAHDTRPLEGFVWYPTDDTAGADTHLGNPVWQGITAIADATPVNGSLPLVVLSHGMYGNARNQAWLAAELSRQGYAVAAIDHPGSSTWSRDPDLSRQLWERPRDISRVIDHLTGPDATLAIDPNHIYMAGHSLGGFTAIALAGGRWDSDGFDAFCTDQPDDLVCGIMDRWHIAQTPEDQAEMEADLSDPRIRAFAVLDPGGVQTFSTASLNAIDRPVLVYGAPDDIMGLNLDVEARALAAALTADTSTYLEPDGLAHFDFLGVCTPNAVEILKEEDPGEEYVCDRGHDERIAEHARIAETITGFFPKQ